MLPDYHTHHFRCGHAGGTMEEYIQHGIARGITDIGLSDHSPIYHFSGDPHPFPKTTMHQDELVNYVAEMKQLRERYAGQINVRLGIESDYILGWDDFYRDLWQQHELDYVIGSVHWLGHWNIFWKDLPRGKMRNDVYNEYFATVQAAARSGVYDIIGHLDVPKTSGHMSGALTPLVDETLQAIKQADVAIELNTSGWRKSVNDCYPSAEILQAAADYAIPVTLGSDAHSPDLVGAGFHRAIALLKQCGFPGLAFFSRRQRTIVPWAEISDLA